VSRRIISDTLLVLSISGIGKLISLARESVISSTYGASMVTDAYFMAYNIPTVIFTAVAASVSTVFLPLYTNSLTREGEEAASGFASNVMTVYIVLAVVMSLAVAVCSRQIVAVMAPTFSPEASALTTRLTMVLCTSFAFSITASVLMSMENARKSFVGPQLAPIFNNLFVMGAVLLLARSYGIYVVAWSAVIGWVLQIPIQAALLRGKFKYHLRFDLGDKSLAAMAVVIGPVLLGTTLSQVNIVVDNMIASRLDVGSISGLNYANRLLNVMSGVLVLATTTVVFSAFAEMAARSEIDRLKRAVRKCVMFMIILLFPVAVICTLYSTDIVSIVFERGAFGRSSTRLTAGIFALYVLGMIPYAIRDVLVRVFYSLQDSRSPLVNGAFVVALNVALSLILVRYLKAAGLALAGSLSGVVACVLLAALLRRKIGSFSTGVLLPQIGKIGFAALLMVGVILLMRAPLSDFGSLVRLASGAIMGTLIYFTSLWMMRVSEVRDGISVISGYLRR
jgi:putative peptidoglycan lipid II flippase